MAAQRLALAHPQIRQFELIEDASGRNLRLGSASRAYRIPKRWRSA